MSADVTTGANNLTTTVEDGGCQHDATGTLNCPGHDYAHLVGVYCRKCKEQFFWPHWPEGCNGAGSGAAS